MKWNQETLHPLVLCPYRVSLWQTQSWKIPLIKGSSPKKYPKRWRLRERWDLKSYWKGLEAHPKIFFFKCLWLTCLDKENYADCLDMQRLLAASFSFIWVSLWKVAQTQDMGSVMMREDISHPCLQSVSHYEFNVFGRAHQKDSRGIIQAWVERKPVKVQMMKEEKVESNRT